MTRMDIGSRVAVGGGYDMEPEWLPDGGVVTGNVVAWLERSATQPACLVALDVPLTAVGLVQGRRREQRTGDHLVLTLRYTGQTWSDDDRTVHVLLCDGPPEQDQVDETTSDGAWVESHATYKPLVT
jgi:hypothetical protein